MSQSQFEKCLAEFNINFNKCADLRVKSKSSGLFLSASSDECRDGYERVSATLAQVLPNDDEQTRDGTGAFVMVVQIGVEKKVGFAVHILTERGVSVFEQFDSLESCVKFVNTLSALLQHGTVRGKAVSIAAREQPLLGCKIWGRMFEHNAMLFVLSQADVHQLVHGGSNINCRKEKLEANFNSQIQYMVSNMLESIETTNNNFQDGSRRQNQKKRDDRFAHASLPNCLVLLIKSLREKAGLCSIPRGMLVRGGNWLKPCLAESQLALLSGGGGPSSSSTVAIVPGSNQESGEQQSSSTPALGSVPGTISATSTTSSTGTTGTTGTTGITGTTSMHGGNKRRLLVPSGDQGTTKRTKSDTQRK